MARAEMPNCKLLSTAAAFVLCDENHQRQAMPKLCRTLWYEKPPNAIAKQLGFCHIFLKISSILQLHY